MHLKEQLERYKEVIGDTMFMHDNTQNISILKEEKKYNSGRN